MEKPFFDIAVIGSGFGGSVVARRLAQASRRLEKPKEIVLLERGRRYEPLDFPRPQLPDYVTDDPAVSSSKRLPDIARLAWTYDQGLWQIRDLRGLRVAVAAGYGGGSLIYASVHLRPPDAVFDTWPRDYRRADLDPYYSLVEAMLDARPAPATFTKTTQMKTVADRLGRDASFFYPPIAITFDDGKSNGGAPLREGNGFGVEQHACVGCGDCIVGCPHTAKNTLDRNYLVGIEDRVYVRTMSEAIAIEPLQDSNKRFCVRYRDHLQGARELELEAKYVFVCGGAVGSTELLFRSKDALGKQWPNNGLDHLGKRFFANGDAPGVIFDTKDKWGPSEGPTITTSLYHTDGNDWFLLQDGAIPVSLRHGLGFLRSPFWFRRNAFGARAQERHVSGRTDGLHELVKSLAAVPQMSNAFAAIVRGQPQQAPGLVSSLLPKSVRDLLAPFDPPGERFWQTITDVDHGVVDRFAGRLREAWPLLGGLIAPGIRWFGRRPYLPPSTVEELIARFSGLQGVEKASSVASLGVATFLELLLGPPPTENTAILLAMGRDSAWKLDWNENARQLSAESISAKNVPLYGLQEQLMRDFAGSLGGELRTNPGWTLGHHPFSVHAQGGCSMTNGAPGVTDPDGLMVNGIKGLYVFDASVFPGSVGVNPSSTIAAVAERNIEMFIRKELNLPDWAAESEDSLHARMLAKQEQWNAGPGPILGKQPPKPPATKASAPALRFEEVMEGFIGRLEGAPPTQEPIEQLQAGEFRDLERRGQRGGQHLRAELTATLRNLEEAVHNPRTQRFTLEITGELHIAWGDRPARRARYAIDGNASSLVIDLNASKAIGSMKYDLRGSAGQEEIRLVGVKQLREDPGLDAWKDLTTLYTIVERKGNSGMMGYGGIIHVPLLDVLGKQFPSMDIVGDDISAERKTWLMLSFVRTFFRGLEQIYTIGEL